MAARTTPTLAHFQHTPFGKREGAPSDIGAFAQTADGFLWIAGARGITRFDGRAFEDFVPASGETLAASQVDVLFAPRNGGMWLGYSGAAVDFLKEGHLTHFGPAQGIVGGPKRFTEGPDGSIWCFSLAGAQVFREGRWETVASAPEGTDFKTGAFDSKGDLWIGSNRGIHLLAAGSRSPRLVRSGMVAVQVIMDTRGALLVRTHDRQIRRFEAVEGLPELAMPLIADATNLLVDKDGNTWIPAGKTGVHFIAVGDTEVETFGAGQGMSGESAWPATSDREGNIWIGTEAGIDRFHFAVLSNVSVPHGMHELAIAPVTKDELWVGSESHSLTHIDGHSITETKVPAFALAISRNAANGYVHTVAAGGVWELAPGPIRLVAPIEGNSRPLANALTQASDGRIWVVPAPSKKPIQSWDGTAWAVYPDLPSGRSIAPGQAGTVWLAKRVPNEVVNTDGKTTKAFGPGQGLDVGTVSSIWSSVNETWVGGSLGLARLDGHQFVRMQMTHPADTSDVTGVVIDREGTMWLQTLAAIFRVPAGELDRFRKDRAYQPVSRRFDASDGLPGSPDPDRALPSVKLADDGRVWFQTASGAAWLDPHDLPTNRVPPAIHIDAVVSGDRTFPIVDGKVELPKDVRALHVNFTAPILSVPEHARFSYRLMGIDDEWQDPGRSRRAIYTNLPAGTYHFAVMAWNEDGVPATQAAMVELRLMPKFYETWWFRLLAVVAIVAFFWSLYLRRLRKVTGAMRIRIEEREAIARDLHDTLLQSVQGTALRLDVLSRRVRDPAFDRADAADELMRLAVDTDAATAEARDKVQALRSQAAEAEDQIGAMLQAAMNVARQHDGKVELTVVGRPRRLRSEPEEEIRMMLGEAVSNAFRHGGAVVAAITVRYGVFQFSVAVRDDGKGFDVKAFGRNGKDGHWGIQGMRERAHRLGGTLRLRNMRSGGFEVLFRAIAGKLYVARRRRH
jgi:signal transduction histidine kinase/ligand-binding sensor domain-containing protein